MNKVRIICICDGIKLPDLGLSLQKGQAAVVSSDQAEDSDDLKRAVRVGGVRATLIKGPSSVRARQPKKPRFERTPAPKRPQEKTLPVKSEVEELREFLETMLENNRKHVESLTASVVDGIEALKSGTQSQTTANIDIGEIEKVLKTALQGVAIPTTSGATVGNLASVGDKGPMFIPEGIVVDTNTDIGASEESSGFSVDEATEALRAMKKTRKSKKKGG